jgi:Skp family chaperone for outer membrane proteins
MFKTLRNTLAIGLLGLGLMTAGCVTHAAAQQKDDYKPAIHVAIVDLGRILPELPEYKEASDEYAHERLELLKDVKMPSKPGQFPDVPKAEQDKVNAAVRRWDDKKIKLMADVGAKVRAASERICKDKGIDIVLVNAPWLPVSQRMAVDITTDVILALRDQGKTVH